VNRRRTLGIVLLVALAASCAATEPQMPTTTSTTVVPPSAVVPPDPSPRSLDGSPAPADADGDPCAGLTLGPPQAISAGSSLPEISGAVLSARDAPVGVWVHQDSGHPAVLTEVALDGTVLGQVTIPEIDPTDWEDIAAAADASGTRHLFVADIGDNRQRRDHVQIVRIPEPSELGGMSATPAVLTLTIASGPTDAEALLIDPSSGDLVVLTKSVSGRSDVLVARAAAWFSDGQSSTLERVATLDLGFGQAVLAGDVAPDGRSVAVRTPGRVLVWQIPPGVAVVDALADGEPCRAPTVFDVFGEALAATDTGYVLTGESDAPVLRVVERRVR
jgi:hypothetical protein